MKVEQFNAARELMREYEVIEKELRGWETILDDPRYLRPFFHHSSYNHYGCMCLDSFNDFRSAAIATLKSRLRLINTALEKI